MMRQARQILAEVYGYPSFRGLQEGVIAHVLAGGDGLLLMPTGGGKSLCFQLPALLRPGLGLVISPLIALMRDQVRALKQLGIQAEVWNSSLSPQEARSVEERIREGSLNLLYLSPERLLGDRGWAMLEGVPLSLIAIDEAHCVSQWGHDFRPEYLALSSLPERFPGVPRLALTATADQPTREEIMERLQLNDGKLFVAGFDRPNIRYQVFPKENDTFQNFLSFLEQEHPGQAGIVYRLSREETEATAARLNSKGIPALPYHAGLSARDRERHQARFLEEEGLVMVATVAFGMGIDKPDVRFVAHLDLPKSIEAYYQETGRAGRDGLPADAWLAYGLRDAAILRHFVDAAESDPEHKRMGHHRLNSLLAYCETTSCRRRLLLHHFGESHPGDCGHCDNCLTPVATLDGTEAARKALSCIYRTGERFGVEHLIHVLLGKETEPVLRHQHHKVSTFAIGKEISARQWRALFRQLVCLGYAHVEVSGHGGLRLDPSCRPLLKGETTFLMRPPPERKRKPAPLPALADESPPGEELWQALRRKRSQIAREQSLPPYVIFHDTTLQAMVAQQPASLEEMGRIFGIGQRKLNRYGEIFLEVIRRHGDRRI